MVGVAQFTHSTLCASEGKIQMKAKNKKKS